MAGLEEYQLAATYRYVDERGELLYERGCFHAPGPGQRRRRFRERRTRDEDWAVAEEFLTGEVRRVPYRLPDLLEGVADGATVFVCEGEKDVERMRALGFVATTTFAQLGTWADDDVPYFKDAHVVLLPDNDDQGHTYANLLMDALNAVAASLVVVGLPGLADGGDISDWLDRGGSTQTLLAMVCASLVEVNAPDGRQPGLEGLVVMTPQQRIATSSSPRANAEPT